MERERPIDSPLFRVGRVNHGKGIRESLAGKKMEKRQEKKERERERGEPPGSRRRSLKRKREKER